MHFSIRETFFKKGKSLNKNDWEPWLKSTHRENFFPKNFFEQAVVVWSFIRTHEAFGAGIVKGDASAHYNLSVCVQSKNYFLCLERILGNFETLETLVVLWELKLHWSSESFIEFSFKFQQNLKKIPVQQISASRLIKAWLFSTSYTSVWWFRLNVNYKYMFLERTRVHHKAYNFHSCICQKCEFWSSLNIALQCSRCQIVVFSLLFVWQNGRQRKIDKKSASAHTGPNENKIRIQNLLPLTSRFSPLSAFYVLRETRKW